MSLPEEIIPYTDGNGLVAPNLVPPGVMRGSDNGPMFTAEYLIMLKYNGIEADPDGGHVPGFRNIQFCVDDNHVLHRAPGDTSPDEVDDNYGVFAAYSVYGLNPHIVLPLRLWRQLQLLLLAITATHGKIPWWAKPLVPLTAILIATSCMGVDPSNSDARRIPWLLIQGLHGKSWLCDLAAKIWYRRLYKTYGPDGMKAVARIYYHGNPEHPFAKYWITEPPK